MNYLIGFQQDLVVAYAQNALSKSPDLGQRIKVLFMEQIVSVKLDCNSYRCKGIVFSDRTIEISEDDRIYLRPYDFEAALREGLMDMDAVSKKCVIYRNLVLSIQTVLGNTTLRADSNWNKFIHLEKFKDLFEIPDQTFEWISRSPSGSGSDDHVVKSASGFRTVVRTEREFLELLPEGCVCPVIRQNFVRGSPIRATVVGFKDVFVTAFHSEKGAADYRYSGDDNQQIAQEIEVSADFKRRLLEAAHRYGNPLTALDFIHVDGRFHFLEINQEPGWAYVGEDQCLRIFKAVLDFMDQSEVGRIFAEPLSGPALIGGSCTIVPSSRELIYYPNDNVPTDYLAKPDEEHPLWKII